MIDEASITLGLGNCICFETLLANIVQCVSMPIAFLNSIVVSVSSQRLTLYTLFMMRSTYFQAHKVAVGRVVLGEDEGYLFLCFEF